MADHISRIQEIDFGELGLPCSLSEWCKFVLGCGDAGDVRDKFNDVVAYARDIINENFFLNGIMLKHIWFVKNIDWLANNNIFDIVCYDKHWTVHYQSCYFFRLSELVLLCNLDISEDSEVFDTLNRISIDGQVSKEDFKTKKL